MLINNAENTKKRVVAEDIITRSHGRIKSWVMVEEQTNNKTTKNKG